ncbi:hypothetical protein DL95DRAFT_471773 [Leptodontidium sp. 2 PMI_412]|nr:hypothetical protein DL95DRAFT_471773 [Leptodontidium sp. 2 PMI_412]
MKLRNERRSRRSVSREWSVFSGWEMRRSIVESFAVDTVKELRRIQGTVCTLIVFAIFSSLMLFNCPQPLVLLFGVVLGQVGGSKIVLIGTIIHRSHSWI